MNLLALLSLKKLLWFWFVPRMHFFVYLLLRENGHQLLALRITNSFNTGSHHCHHVTELCSFYRMHCIYIHCKCTFVSSSPSEFFAEIITNTLQYIMICDPLLKLLVILYIMSLNAYWIYFARIYIWYIQEGISVFT